MLRKPVFIVGVCLLMLLVTAGPALAMLKVLDAELSNELREIAKEHLVRTENIEAGAVTIEEGWVREFRNAGVDVYMVEAIVDKGLAGERKVQLPVRVDQKIVISEAELAALEEEDNTLAADEPQVRITTTAEGEPVAEAEDLASGNGKAFYYGTALALAALLTGTALIFRQRAKRAKRT